MIHDSRSRPRNIVLAALACGCLAACDEPGSPTAAATENAARAAASTSPQQTTPYYYHRGDRIFLEPDGTQLIVAGGDLDASAVVDRVELSAPTDVAVMEVGRLMQRGNHWMVSLEGLDPPDLDQLVNALREDDAIPYIAPLYRTVDDAHRVALLNEIDIHLRDGASDAVIDSLVNVEGMRLIHEPLAQEGRYSYRLAYPAGSDPLNVAEELRALSGADWVAPNMTSERRRQAPGDTYFSEQFYLDNSNMLNSVDVDINPDSAWTSYTGSGVTVVIIDDGVDPTHPDMPSGAYVGWDAPSLSSLGMTARSTRCRATPTACM